jgi:dGTPase
VHELIDWQVNDTLAATAERLKMHNMRSAEDVQRTPTLVLPGAELAELKAELERFLQERVYRHPDLLAFRQRAQERLRGLFEWYLARPERLPTTFRARIAADGIERTVGDYLAGMTDRFADQEYDRRIAAATT